jgi:hypothetical protein
MMAKLPEVLSAGPTTPIRTTSEFLAAFNQRDAYRYDSSAVTHDEALELAAVEHDWITISTMVGSNALGRSASNTRAALSNYATTSKLLAMGHRSQRGRQKDRRTLVFDVGHYPSEENRLRNTLRHRSTRRGAGDFGIGLYADGISRKR